MDNAEKELMFSLSKSYDLYNYMLQLIVAITGEARKRYDVEVVRAQREGLQEPSARLAFNKFAVQLEENKMLLDWIDVKHSNWDENIEVVRSLYNTITSSDLYADYPRFAGTAIMVAAKRVRQRESRSFLILFLKMLFFW